VRIGNCRIAEIVDPQLLPIGTDDEQCIYESRLPSPLFDAGWYRTLSTSDGMVFTEVQSAGAREEADIDIANKGSSLKFTFQLQTKSSYVGLENTDCWLQYTPGASHLLSPLVHRGKLRVEPGVELHQDTLFIPVEKAAALLEEEQRKVPVHLQRMLSRPESGPLLYSGAMSPRIWTVLQEMQSCPFQGRLKRVYLETKLTELALLRLSDELSPPPSRLASGMTVKLSRLDRHKLEEAAELLGSRIQHPPTLHELSVLVGLNVNKLKQGFHWLYGTTVFCFLHSLRMRQAYRLLWESDLSISEISEQIGYSRQSAFSAAFRREYGFPPRELKKRCR
jgi:AraC-like DNA-binding protein